MSTSVSEHRVRGASNAPSTGSDLSNARAYFRSDVGRWLQTALRLLWLLGGGLQFQSFMYSKGFHPDADRHDRWPGGLAGQQHELLRSRGRARLHDLQRAVRLALEAEVRR